MKKEQNWDFIYLVKVTENRLKVVEVMPADCNMFL